MLGSSDLQCKRREKGSSTRNRNSRQKCYNMKRSILVEMIFGME